MRDQLSFGLHDNSALKIMNVNINAFILGVKLLPPEVQVLTAFRVKSAPHTTI